MPRIIRIKEEENISQNQLKYFHPTIQQLLCTELSNENRLLSSEAHKVQR